MKQTVAEKLVWGDYGLSFKEPYPEQAGQMRARKREDEEKKGKEKHHPPVETMTRQRKRQAERKQLKRLKSRVKADRAKNKKKILMPIITDEA